MRCAPFRKAHLKDPYFKRLSAVDKKPFWYIFKNIESSSEFKDLFEKITRRDPDERLTLRYIMNHTWVLNGDRMDDSELKEDILKRF